MAILCRAKVPSYMRRVCVAMRSSLFSTLLALLFPLLSAVIIVLLCGHFAVFHRRLLRMVKGSFGRTGTRSQHLSAGRFFRVPWEGTASFIMASLDYPAGDVHSRASFRLTRLRDGERDPRAFRSRGFNVPSLCLAFLFQPTATTRENEVKEAKESSVSLITAVE